jgi:hypothetical protein
LKLVSVAPKMSLVDLAMSAKHVPLEIESENEARDIGDRLPGVRNEAENTSSMQRHSRSPEDRSNCIARLLDRVTHHRALFSLSMD